MDLKECFCIIYILAPYKNTVQEYKCVFTYFLSDWVKKHVSLVSSFFYQLQLFRSRLSCV